MESGEIQKFHHYTQMLLEAHRQILFWFENSPETYQNITAFWHLQYDL